MAKKFVALFLILCIITLSFCGCSEDEEINAIYPISADPECLDPQIAENPSAKLIVTNCMEGLVRVGADGSILPGVAESWSVSADGLTYTFDIRDNACWQMLKSHEKVLGEDYETAFSKKVVAADCAFGIERALRPETKAENAYLLFAIKNAEKFNNGEVDRNQLGINVVNDSTLVIHLERAYPDFLRILTEPMCMPCDEAFFQATGAKYGLELKYTLCNGPYYVGRWVDDGSLTLYKNEDYVGYTAFNTNAVYLYVNNNEQQYITKFNQGDYNIMSVSHENMNLVNVNDDIMTLSSVNSVYGFMFNCSDPVLSETSIRKALLLATDIRDMYKDDIPYSKASGVVPDSCMWADKSYRESAGTAKILALNQDKALEFFKDGVKELDITNINVSIICEEIFRIPIIRTIQKWEKIFGLAITVSVDSVDSDELKAAVEKGEYQIAFTSLACDDGNVIPFLNRFTTESESDLSFYQNKRYDDIINGCKNTYSGSEIVKKCVQCEQMLIDDGVFYPVYTHGETAFLTKDLSEVFALPGLERIDFAAWRIDDEN